jgi:hypothetical protein
MYELPNLKRIVIQKTGSVVLKRTRSKALAKLARMPRTPLFAVASVVEDGVLYFGYSPRRAKAASLAAHVVAGAPGGVMGMAGGAAFWGLREGVRYVW